MAYGAAGAADVSIYVKNLKSKPYIDLTLQVMKHFGIEVENRNYQDFYFKPQPSEYKPGSYVVEGDWSGGAFLLVAGAIAGNIIVKGLDVASTQADKEILAALKSCGAAITVNDDEIEIGHAILKSFDFDATDCPDLFPPLVALAAYCEGTSTITGISRLAHKESNRALTLQDEFEKMGIDIKLKDDRMFIKGGVSIKGAVVHSRHDHRIAMACAVAALKADGETIIKEADAINKSYPDFYSNLELLGAWVETEDARQENNNFEINNLH
jgi:3-phosphoshikimate 1-carboxyvinyltransferase